MKCKIFFLVIYAYINTYSQRIDTVNFSVRGINSKVVLENTLNNTIKVIKLNVNNQHYDTIKIKNKNNDTSTKFILNDTNFVNILKDTNIFKDKNIFLNKLDSISLKKIVIYNFFPVNEITESSDSDSNNDNNFFDKISTYISNNLFIIFLIFFNILLFIIIIICFSKLIKVKKDLNLISERENIKYHFEKYKFKFTKNNFKDRIDELFDEYTNSKEDIKKLEERYKKLENERDQLVIDKEKYFSDNDALSEKFKLLENEIQNKIDFISDIETKLNIAKEELSKEKESHLEIITISNILINKFNNKSQEIQELASKESIEEAKKSYLKALIFMTFHSRSLIKKITVNDSKYDEMNNNLLNDKNIKPNKIINSNVKYDDVEHLVYVTIKLFKDYKINGIDDVFFNGNMINDK